MAEINYEQVFLGVISALSAAYPAKHVFGETVPQGLTDGSFNVLPVAALFGSALGSRGKRTAVLDIVYYPDRAPGRDDALGIAGELPGILETIETPNGNKLHCLGAEMELTDDALHCTARFPYQAYIPPEGDRMTFLEKEEIQID